MLTSASATKLLLAKRTDQQLTRGREKRVQTVCYSNTRVAVKVTDNQLATFELNQAN